MRRFLIALTLLSCASPLALATDNGVYLGAGVTQTKIDGLTGQLDLDDTSFKLIVGVRPLDYLAVELNYVDLGSEELTIGSFSTEVKARAAAAFALGMMDVPFGDLYVKAGLARWENEITQSGVTLIRLDDDGTEFAYGAGVQARFGSLAARLEYETFDVEDTSGVDLYTLALTWTFL